MTRALVIAEPGGQRMLPCHRQLLGAIASLRAHISLECDLLSLDDAELHKELLALQGVDRVLVPELLPNTLAETLAPWIADVAQGYDYLFFAASSFGKDLMPRVAALLDIQPISDLVAVEAANCFVRPVYAGSALARISTSQARICLSVRCSAFPMVEFAEGRADLLLIPGPIAQAASRLVGEQKATCTRPELTTARVVVSGGRGLQTRENFELIYRLADKLGAAVGASRAAVDAGIVANDLQVGQTGKVVAPGLYIAAAISGAVQHLAGMSASGVIVAINKDPEAPIFEVADYGLVGDVFDVLPALIEQL